MNTFDYRRVIDKIKCKQDDRNPPDERRKRRFRAGWKDAALKGVKYRDKTLRVLTWQNLGYRFGEVFGPVADLQMDEAYSYLADLYRTGHADMFVVAPDASQYVKALRSARCSDSQRQMLEIHYTSPERTITAKQMSKQIGYESYSAANLFYGKLGRLIGEHLDFNPWKERLGTLVTFKKRNGEWHWTMRTQLAEALEVLGWVESPVPPLPEEVAEGMKFVEGAVRKVSIDAYERDAKARRKCIEHYGVRCHVCGFDFGQVYGETVEGYIHVHHLRPLSEVGAKHEVDPKKDLCPVCPNCHAVLHSKKPAYTIEEVRALLRDKGTE